ncbi:hypothetical protein COOONC_00119 [Cooperia oncophora]
MWQPQFTPEHTSVTNTELADSHPGVVTSQATNPFGAVPFNAQGGTPQHLQHVDAQRFASADSSSNNSPVPFQSPQQHFSQNVENADRQVPPSSIAETVSSQPKGIYEQTPFCRLFTHCMPSVHQVQFNSTSFSAHADGSYSGPSPFSVGAMQSASSMPRNNEQISARESTFDPFTTQQGQGKIGSDIDSALSNLADNLSISASNQGRPVQWGGPQQQGPAQMQIPSSVTAPSVGAPPMASYGAPPQYTTPFGQYAPQAYPGAPMGQWQVQPHVFPAPQHTQGAPSGYSVYGGAAMGYGQVAQPHPQSGQDPFGF